MKIKPSSSGGVGGILDIDLGLFQKRIYRMGGPEINFNWEGRGVLMNLGEGGFMADSIKEVTLNSIVEVGTINLFGDGIQGGKGINLIRMGWWTTKNEEFQVT